MKIVLKTRQRSLREFEKSVVDGELGCRNVNSEEVKDVRNIAPQKRENSGTVAADRTDDDPL